MVNLLSSEQEFLRTMIQFTDYIVYMADTGYWVIQVDRLNERDILLDRLENGKTAKSKMKTLSTAKTVIEQLFSTIQSKNT